MNRRPDPRVNERPKLRSNAARSGPRTTSRTGTLVASRAIARTNPRLLAFNKPFGVLCQFTRDGDRPTLADFIRVPEVYPAGRLDTDSEGLLLLTDHGPLQNDIAHPTRKLAKTYWAQVEGEPTENALISLRAPLNLGDFVTSPCQARRIEEPAGLWLRDPPIRQRAAIPTAWLEITITEGKNRQIRRMTAAVGHPTLRLIRYAVGPYQLDGLAPGKWVDADPQRMSRKAAVSTAPNPPR